MRVVDHLGEQGNGVRNEEDRELRYGSETENREAECNRLDAFARTNNRAVDESVGMAVIMLRFVRVAMLVRDDVARQRRAQRFGDLGELGRALRETRRAVERSESGAGSERQDVRGDARPARVATDGGHRGVVAVLRSGLVDPARPDRLHGTNSNRQEATQREAAHPVCCDKALERHSRTLVHDGDARIESVRLHHASSVGACGLRESDTSAYERTTSKP